MVGILEKFADKRKAFERKQNVLKANKLAGLREERLRQEGIVKVNKAYNDEKLRIKKARKERFNNSLGGKLASGIVKNVRENQKKNKKKGGGITL